MGKIKGWTKFQNSRGIERWRNETNPHKEVRLAGPTVITEPVDSYFVEIPNEREPQWYDTLKDARARAMRYMRSHPNG